MDTTGDATSCSIGSVYRLVSPHIRAGTGTVTRFVNFFAMLPETSASRGRRSCSWPSSAGALETGQWLPVLLLFAMILGFGAALASFGLALATRLQRVGSALAWCVGTYVFITVVWVLLMMVLFRGHDEVICSGSPFVAAAILTACGEDVPMPDVYGRALCWNLIWFAVYMGTALFLFRWTVRNFNRYCGRMEDKSQKRPCFW